MYGPIFSCSILNGEIPPVHGAFTPHDMDVSLQEAWAKTPNGKKRETAHIVRCETEIFRVKNS